MKTAILIGAVLLFGCDNSSQNEPLYLPETPVLTMSTQWGVVAFDFLRIRREPTKNAEIVSYLRRGAVVEVVSRTDGMDEVEGESAFWYRVFTDEGVLGWVFGAYLQVVDSKEGAEAVSRGES